MKKLKILNVILGILFILGVLAFVLTGSDATFGYTARIVISGSMEPTIPVYTLNIIKECDISDIDEGDIVLYRYKSDIIHRVIEIRDNDAQKILITQGDANDAPDNIEIKSEMVIGKVVKTLGWTKYILGPIRGGSRVSIQTILFICILILYILHLVVKRYMGIYYIYARDDKGLDSTSDKSIRARYTDSKAKWKKAENEYLANRAIKENKSGNSD